jgi:hypothetical protein
MQRGGEQQAPIQAKDHIQIAQKQSVVAMEQLSQVRAWLNDHKKHIARSHDQFERVESLI